MFVYDDCVVGATKHIESLAKLVNQGHAEWSSGDMITANAVICVISVADFVFHCSHACLFLMCA